MARKASQTPGSTAKSSMERGASGPNPCIIVQVGAHSFAIPIARVEDVFVVTSLASVPMAPPEVVGLLNLRGRVITALSLAVMLGLDDVPLLPAAGRKASRMAVGVAQGGEIFGLLVSSVGDVLELALADRAPMPSHFDPRWSAHAAGIHRVGEELLIELDIDALLLPKPAAKIAFAA